MSIQREALWRALEVRDCTDPAHGPHAMQQVVSEVVGALREGWRCEVWLRRASPVVSVTDNYDRLRYPPDGAARDARYTRYLQQEGEARVLRTQTSAMVPPLLDELARAGVGAPADVLLACPGVVYRRDCIDRLHLGEPHQMDLWRIRRAQPPLDDGALLSMIGRVVEAALPGRAWRVSDAVHPYTVHGLQIDVREGDEWIEIGECGLAHPELLRDAGLDTAWSGLAMGIGLDRMVMLRKGVDDIRLLRSADPRVAAQMLDLAPYRVVSSMPPVRRDLSIVVDSVPSAEEIGDVVREVLGARADWVESVEVVSVTACAELPGAARARLGIAPDQHNVLLRVVLRAIDRTLTHAECNVVRDEIYAALHRGAVWHWATGAAPKA